MSEPTVEERLGEIWSILSDLCYSNNLKLSPKNLHAFIKKAIKQEPKPDPDKWWISCDEV